MFLLFIILTATFSPCAAEDGDYDYFKKVADASQSTKPLSTLNVNPSHPRRNPDQFPAVLGEGKLVTDFMAWANLHPRFPPLSTWRPPTNLDNITDNAFGAVTKRCPSGCYLSRAGTCIPAFSASTDGGALTNSKVYCSVGSSLTTGISIWILSFLVYVSLVLFIVRMTDVEITML